MLSLSTERLLPVPRHSCGMSSSASFVRAPRSNIAAAGEPVSDRDRLARECSLVFSCT